MSEALQTIHVDFVPHDVLTLPGRLGLIHGVHADSDECFSAQEVETLRKQYLVDTLVLIESDEDDVAKVDLAAARLNMCLRHWSFGSLADDSRAGRLSELASYVAGIQEHLENGLTVAVSYCPTSLDAILFTACLLVSTGVETEVAARAAGLDAEEDDDQFNFLKDFTASLTDEPKSLLDQFEAHFRDGGKRYHRFSDRSLIEVYLTGKSGTYACYVAAYEDTRQVVVLVSAPVRVPAERRLAVCEYASRVNFTRRVGSFELDMTDGEVRYRTGIDVEGGELTETMIKNLMAATFCGMEHHLPALLSVAFAGTSAEDALSSLQDS